MSQAARKRELRDQLLSSRKLRPPTRAVADACAALVAARPEFIAAGSLALYAALPDELSTVPLFEMALHAGKRVAFPRIEKGGVLSFGWARSFEDLRPGRYGVLEPPQGSASVALAEVGLAVLPGVAFDRAGGRLGRGGGYYDRALAGTRRPPPFVVGIAESTHIVEVVPAEAFDQRVDAVATEREWVGCSSTRHAKGVESS